MYPEQPKVLGSLSASAAWSASSPPVPFGSYRFSQPGNDSIHPGRRTKHPIKLCQKKERNERRRDLYHLLSFDPNLIYLDLKKKKKQKNYCGYRPTYTTVSRLVHVPFHLPGIRHQVLHPSVLQSCRIWGREDGLDPVAETQFSTAALGRVTAELGMTLPTRDAHSGDRS